MEQNEASIKIGKRTFITAVIILGILMITVGILTRVIPQGSYDRVLSDGREVIVQNTYHATQVPTLPIWRWFTAPIEVLGSADGATIIVIVFFLFAVAGAFSLLEKSGVMELMLSKIVRRFIKRKYLLMAVVVFFFMLLGAVIGTFEENIVLVPFMIALSYCLGWDTLVGLGMSILASCFGFTAAITNPFSIAITQRISDLPLYSGSAFRVVVFIVYFALTLVFLMRYAKKIEKDPTRSLVYGQDGDLRRRYLSAESLETALDGKSELEIKKLNHAILAFCVFVVFIFAAMIASSMIPAFSDIELPVVGLLFLIGGITAGHMAGVRGKQSLKVLGSSAAGIAPGVLLILMAMSVKFIISEGGIMDTILYHAANAIQGTSPYAAILLVYVLILILELFVGSSSAKAFLVMPLIAPLSDLVGITRQTSVLAFCFGDGFSNVLYPTNPVLLICLGLTVVTFPKWIKWTWKLQLLAFAIACGFLLLGVALKLGPF